MERIKDWITEHKKQSIAIAVVIILVICGCIGGCVALTGNKDDKSVVTEKEEKQEMEFTAEDLAGVVTGLDGDTYILAGADVDLLSLIAYDDSIVTAVAADTSSLDVATPGDYTVTLEFTVDAKALCDYLGEDFDADKYEDTAKITVEKVIKVVDQATAQGLADGGTPVYNGTGSTIPKSDGTAVEATVAAPESTSKTGGTSEAGNTKSTASTTVRKDNTSKPAAGSNSGSSGNTGNSGNSGSNTSTSTGNSGSSSNSGSSGNSGNTGSSSNSGSSGSTGSSGSSGSSSNSGSSGSSSNSGSSSGGSSSSQPSHTHNWVAETTTVEHPAEGHYQTVVIEQGYTKPIYEYRIYCRVCDKLYFNSVDEAGDHSAITGHSYATGNVLVGEEKVPAKTQDVWVVDKQAWTEEVPTGRYICSGCGAVK